MDEVLEIPHAAMLLSDDGFLLDVGPEESVRRTAAKLSREAVDYGEVDCLGLVALPGFVDSHTHAVFLGERSNEFVLRAEGRSYEEVAAAGGGILSTVEAVRHASAEDIANYSERYIYHALALGTTTMEVKSGYGLTPEAELSLLDAAHLLGERTPMEIIPTFLGAHAVPQNLSREQYVEQILEEQLPLVASRKAARFCDVFMDAGYFTGQDTKRIFRKASELGLDLRLHADELADTGAAKLAAEFDAFSADHLLKIGEEGISALAQSKRTVATLLPVTALSLRTTYAPARRLIEAGAAVAIATDFNPGSSMSENMQFALSLAVIGMQMSVRQALTAATLNGAAALGLERTHGSLERSKVADVVFYDIPRLEYLPYHIAVSDVVSTMKRGEIVLGEVL